MVSFRLEYLDHVFLIRAWGFPSVIWCSSVSWRQHFGECLSSECVYWVTPQWNQRGNSLCHLPSTALQTVTKGHWDSSLQFENITVNIFALPHQVSVRAGGRIPDQVIPGLIQHGEAHCLKTPLTANAQSSFEEKPSHTLSRAAGWYFLLIFSSQPFQSLYHSHLCTGGLLQRTRILSVPAQILWGTEFVFTSCSGKLNHF